MATYFMKEKNYLLSLLPIGLLTGNNYGNVSNILSPIGYINQIYHSSDLKKIIHKNFDKLSTKKCQIIFIINDKGSTQKILEVKDNLCQHITELCFLNEIDNDIFITDCVLCGKICSITNPMEELCELSQMWGICKNCYTDM